MKASYFVDLRKAPRIRQMEGLETAILTGLHGEKMVMVLNATLLRHNVPLNSQVHEQIGWSTAAREFRELATKNAL